MSEFAGEIKLEALPPSSDTLNQVSLPVGREHITDPDIQGIIDGMFDIAYGRQGNKEQRTMVGLAAPQLGILKRIIIVGVDTVGMGESPDLQAFIDPEITYASEEKETNREGCFSTGNICGVLERSKIIRIRAYDRNGQEVSDKFEGFPARIFQHEIDHLEGLRFPDRISDTSKLHWVEPDEFGAYRTQWHEWTQLCPPNVWEDMKNGKT